jgi:hypothetical protein
MVKARHVLVRTAPVAVAVAVLAALWATPGDAAPECTITWTGGGESNIWSAPANWAPERLPGATDHVCIPPSATVEMTEGASSVLTLDSEGIVSIRSGELKLTGSERSTTARLIQSGGRLGGSGSLTVENHYEWSGGEQVEGGVTDVAPGGSLSIKGYVYLENGRTLQIEAGASATMAPGGHLYVGEGAQLVNAGSFNADGSEETADGILSQGAGSSVRNTGSFVRSGNGSFAVGVAFDNEGSVTAEAGELRLEKGGTESSAATFVGSGSSPMVFAAGTFTFASGASVAGRVVQSGGKLKGPLLVKGDFEWSGGEQIEGVTEVASGGTLPIKGYVYLERERVLQIDSGATATMKMGGHLSVGEGAQLANAGSFNAEGGEETGDGILSQSSGGSVHNAGTFTRSGSGSFSVTVPFDNEGSVVTSAGTLSLDNGGNESSTASFSGSGGEGSFVRFAAGTFTFASGASVAGRVVQSGGKLKGPLSVKGDFEWSGGQQVEGSVTDVAPGGKLSIKGYVELENGRALQIEAGASATMTPGAHLYVGEGAQLANAGSFEADGDQEAGDGIFSQGSGGSVHNVGGGTFTRSGNGSFSVTVAFDNEGTVTAESGELLLEKGGTESSGATFVGTGSGGRVSFASGTFTFAGGVSMSGRVAQTGGRLQGPLLVKGGFEWSGGEQVEGLTEVAAGGGLSIKGYAYLGRERVLQVDAGASATMAAGGHLYVGEGAEIANAGSFNADGNEETGDGISRQTAGGEVVNTGTFSRSGNGPFYVNVPFVNEGTVDIARGVLAMTTFRQAAAGVLGVHLAGAQAGTGYSQLSIGGVGSISGTLRVTSEGGFHPEPGQAFQVVVANSLSGVFSAVEEVGSIGGGWSYTTKYSATGAELVVAGGPVPTTTNASISGGGQAGGSITVPEGTVVSAGASLAGADIASATGVVFYKVYSDAECRNEVANAGSVAVSGGAVPGSSQEVFGPGTYYWQASYSGDATNRRSASQCGTAVEQVQAKAKVETALPKAVSAASETPLPPPVSGHSASLFPVAGTVSVRLPGHGSFEDLAKAKNVPVGTTVNTTLGHVELCRATVKGGQKQCAEFNSGEFRIEEKAGGSSEHLQLTGGSFSGCPASRAGAARAGAGRRGSGSARKLWGSGHGHFTTDGRNSSTTVRGTIWFVEDRCDYTLTRVVRGVVAVYDYRLHRTISVSAGHRYVARAR